MNEENRVYFEFFTHLPGDVHARPPLASSLQSFESHLFLLALGRYPHAFTSCVFAIESAIKAGLAIRPRERVDLQELLQRTRIRIPAVAEMPLPALDDLRQTRNRIVHYGFSPADDQVTAALLLGSAIPVLQAVYTGFFGFALLPSLLPPVGAQIEGALAFFSGTKADSAFPPQMCFAGLAHWVRRAVGEATQSGAETTAAERGRTSGIEWEEVSNATEELERALEPSWVFDCPVCDTPGTFVVQLDFDEEASPPVVRVLRGVCAACDLNLPALGHSLAHHLCVGQVFEHQDRILREYGFGQP